MKHKYILAIVIIFFNYFVYSQIGIPLNQDVYEIEIKPAPVPPGLPPICPTDCDECGKLIFITYIAKLKFSSDMLNIRDVKEIVTVNDNGMQIFTYHVVTKALPIQHIKISSNTIVGYDLKVVDLEPATCQEYYINFKTRTSVNNPIVQINPPVNSPPINIKNDSLIILQKLNSEIQEKIAKQSKKQSFWIVSTILTAGGGGYFFVASDKKYEEYMKSTDSRASELRKTVELYDKVGPVLFGLAGLSVLELTIHSIRKANYKNKLKLNENKLKVISNGNSLGLALEF